MIFTLTIGSTHGSGDNEFSHELESLLVFCYTCIITDDIMGAVILIST